MTMDVPDGPDSWFSERLLSRKDAIAVPSWPPPPRIEAPAVMAAFRFACPPPVAAMTTTGVATPATPTATAPNRTLLSITLFLSGSTAVLFDGPALPQAVISALSRRCRGEDVRNLSCRGLDFFRRRDTFRPRPPEPPFPTGLRRKNTLREIRSGTIDYLDETWPVA